VWTDSAMPSFRGRVEDEGEDNCASQPVPAKNPAENCAEREASDDHWVSMAARCTSSEPLLTPSVVIIQSTAVKPYADPKPRDDNDEHWRGAGASPLIEAERADERSQRGDVEHVNGSIAPPQTAGQTLVGPRDRRFHKH